MAVSSTVLLIAKNDQHYCRTLRWDRSKPDMNPGFCRGFILVTMLLPLSIDCQHRLSPSSFITRQQMYFVTFLRPTKKLLVHKFPNRNRSSTARADRSIWIMICFINQSLSKPFLPVDKIFLRPCSRSYCTVSLFGGQWETVSAPLGPIVYLSLQRSLPSDSSRRCFNDVRCFLCKSTKGRSNRIFVLECEGLSSNRSFGTSRYAVACLKGFPFWREKPKFLGIWLTPSAIRSTTR